MPTAKFMGYQRTRFDQDPLTYRYPRTLSEVEADPSGWYTSALAQEHEEQRIREMFAEPARRERLHRSWVITDWIVYAALIGVLAAVVSSWL